jgi:hypothetical protein
MAPPDDEAEFDAADKAVAEALARYEFLIDQGDEEMLRANVSPTAPIALERVAARLRAILGDQAV